MATTLEDLERRLSALEQAVATLGQRLQGQAVEETPAGWGARLLREARAGQAALSAGVASAFAQMGIAGAPVGAEKVQEMIAACGIKPEDNEFSRGIIEMREE
jgi:hypothetical protein